MGYEIISEKVGKAQEKSEIFQVSKSWVFDSSGLRARIFKLAKKNKTKKAQQKKTKQRTKKTWYIKKREC